MTYNDLDETTKDILRDRYRDVHVEYDWWEWTYEDFNTIASIIGLDIAREASRPNGGMSTRLCIYFEGFYFQGSHAAFEGQYKYKEGAMENLAEHCTDDELQNIVQQLTAAQVQCRLVCGSTIETQINSNMRCDSSLVNDKLHFDSSLVNDEYFEGYSAFEKAIEGALKDLADWLYRQLQDEYEHLTSDETIDEWLSDTDNLS